MKLFRNICIVASIAIGLAACQTNPIGKVVVASSASAVTEHVVGTWTGTFKSTGDNTGVTYTLDHVMTFNADGTGSYSNEWGSGNLKWWVDGRSVVYNAGKGVRTCILSEKDGKLYLQTSYRGFSSRGFPNQREIAVSRLKPKKKMSAK